MPSVEVIVPERVVRRIIVLAYVLPAVLLGSVISFFYASWEPFVILVIVATVPSVAALAAIRRFKGQVSHTSTPVVPSERPTSTEEVKRDLSEVILDLEKYRIAFEHAGEHMVVTDADGVILHANAAAEALTGYTREEMTGKTPSLWGKRMNPSFYRSFWQTIKEEKKPFVGTLVNRRKNGTEYHASVVVTPVLDSSGAVRFFIGIERDITKERETERLRNEFLSLATHELRVPITTVKWNAEMLLDGDAGQLTPEQTERVRDIAESNARMLYLLTSLLNVSRIETGRLTVTPVPTDALSLARSVVDTFDKVASGLGVSLSYRSTGEPGLVMQDPSLVRYALTSLVSNAIRYTPRGGRVAVSGRVDDTWVVFDVEDTGLGVPSGEQDKLFTKFYRGSNIRQMEAMGSGLGLYITKSIAGLCGGTVSFVSEEGKGSTFTLRIPVAGAVPRKGEVGLA